MIGSKNGKVVVCFAPVDGAARRFHGVVSHGLSDIGNHQIAIVETIHIDGFGDPASIGETGTLHLESGSNPDISEVTLTLLAIGDSAGMGTYSHRFYIFGDGDEIDAKTHAAAMIRAWLMQRQEAICVERLTTELKKLVRKAEAFAMNPIGHLIPNVG